MELTRLKNTWLDYVIWLAFLITIVCVFVTLQPCFPRTGLDPSWSSAMNEAISLRKPLGQAVVFTFGPYISLFTGEYHPNTSHLMFLGSVVFAVSFFLVIFLLCDRNYRLWLVLFMFFLTWLFYSRDSTLLSYVLLISILIYRMALPATDPNHLHLSRYASCLIPLLFINLGLLPLVKGSFLPPVAVSMLLGLILLVYARRYDTAFSLATIPLLAGLLFWRVSGQELVNLPAYFTSMYLLISGYSEAMAVPGRTWEIVLFTLNAIVLLFVLVRSHRLPWSLFITLSFALHLFMGFKNGFVRHDLHVLSALTAMLMASLAAVFIVRKKLFVMVLVTSVLSCGYIASHHIDMPGYAQRHFTNTFSLAGTGIYQRMFHPSAFESAFHHSRLVIRQNYYIPKLQGTTDIYPWEQSLLLASDNHWNSRPVFQSYSAYMPRLLELNAQHLQGPEAPDNILFKLETIDNRFPSLDDGLSWPILINNYALVRYDHQFALLRKRGGAIQPPLKTPIQMAPARLGDTIELPDTRNHLFVQIQLSPTLSGRLVKLLFKPPQLNLYATLANGAQKEFRIISGMTATGFIISPLVEYTKDFVLLVAGHSDELAHKKVTHFRVSADNERLAALMWQTAIDLKLFELTFPLKEAIAPVDLKHIVRPRLALAEDLGRPVTCQGSIDMINNIQAPPPYSIFSTSELYIHGWQAVAAEEGIVPEEMLVTLTDEEGHRQFFPASQLPRPDVNRHFNQPDLPDPGFKAYIDTSDMRGNYILGLARRYQGTFEICQQALGVQINSHLSID